MADTNTIKQIFSNKFKKLNEQNSIAIDLKKSINQKYSLFKKSTYEVLDKHFYEIIDNYYEHELINLHEYTELTLIILKRQLND